MDEHVGMTTRIFACLMLRASVVAVLLESSGPTLAADFPVTAASVAARAGPLESIATLIGDAECDYPSQCHAIGVGAKSCGGPDGYLAWSDKKTDASALHASAEVHAEAQKEQNRIRGLASNCMILPEPTTTCRPRASDGRKTCQLSQGGARSAI